MEPRDPNACGRILALDLGARRIGAALSDPLGLTAQGIQTITRTNIREDLAQLSEIIRQNDVTLILLGNPLHMSGNEGRQSVWVRDFAERLKAHTGLPVRLWDERLTSVEAGRVLRSSGISIEKRARAVDRLSAVLLLQSYLEAQSVQGAPSDMNE
ncbi:MAG: Holliday junction resolvase RuvX [Acidobacteriales bacterium]|nr:Holliday junction resolvase RuvX [Terriglobales bacterium]